MTTEGPGPRDDGEAAAHGAELNKRRRKHRNTIIAVAFAALLFVVVLGIGLRLDPNKIPSALLCKPAPNFSAKLFNGNEAMPGQAVAADGVFELSRLKGHPVVLNYWASWCFSCRAEARDLQSYWEAVQAEGVLVLGVAVQDSEEDARGFAETYGKRYVLATDHTGRAALEYGVTGVPETFIVNKDGIIVRKFTGPVTQAELTQVIDNIDAISVADCPGVNSAQPSSSSSLPPG